MKIQLDTINKNIKLESTTNLKELFDFLEKILPNNEWQNFSLESNVTINNWHSPIVIEKYIPHQPYRFDWLRSVEVNHSDPLPDTNKIYCLNNGVYNLEAKSL